MTLPARFSLLDARLDGFLFATIGEEENGMPLSVASALARLGFDPWTEAGRLAALPQAKAIESLVSLIPQIPLARDKPSDPLGIATGLILLLRAGASHPAPQARASTAGRPRLRTVILLLCLGLLALAAFSSLVGGTSLLDSSGSPGLEHKATR